MHMSFSDYLASRTLRQSGWGKLVSRHLAEQGLPSLNTWDEVRRFARHSGVKREDVRSTWSAYVQLKRRLATTENRVADGDPPAAPPGEFGEHNG